MAHRGEAQTFINKLGLKTEDKKFYTGTKIALLLTGEGTTEVLTKLPYYIAKYPIVNIINFGIAGALSENIQLRTIYTINEVFSFAEGSKRFKKFKTNNLDSTLNCISSETRVLNNQYANQLSEYADIVDMELWAIAKTAKEYNLPFKSYKLISDIAGKKTQCDDLKKMAGDFSDQMYKYFVNLKIEI